MAAEAQILTRADIPVEATWTQSNFGGGIRIGAKSDVLVNFLDRIKMKNKSRNHSIGGEDMPQSILLLTCAHRMRLTGCECNLE